MKNGLVLIARVLMHTILQTLGNPISVNYMYLVPALTKSLEKRATDFLGAIVLWQLKPAAMHLHNNHTILCHYPGIKYILCM